MSDQDGFYQPVLKVVEEVASKLRKKAAKAHQTKVNAITDLTNDIAALNAQLAGLRLENTQLFKHQILQAYRAFFTHAEIEFDEYEKIISGNLSAKAELVGDRYLIQFKKIASENLHVLLGIAEIFLAINSHSKSGPPNSGVEVASPSVSWVNNPLQADKDLYHQIYGYVEDLVETLSRSNSLAHLKELDELRRTNLINSLKTILAMLEAPMIETSLVKNSKDNVQSLREAMEKEVVGQGSKKVVESGIWALGQIVLKIKDWLPPM